MKKIICAMQVSLDGYIEGPAGELDWIENWEDSYGLMAQVDTCVLGAGMYPGYEQYWSAVLDAPDAPLPFAGKTATAGEIALAQPCMWMTVDARGNQASRRPSSSAALRFQIPCTAASLSHWPQPSR